jgi:hypothetical protein
VPYVVRPHFVSRAVGLVAVLVLAGACENRRPRGDVVGVENRCGVALEVSVGDVEPVEQWTSVATGTWERVSTVDHGVPFLFWFRAAGDASAPAPVRLEAADVVRSVGGPLDLLIVVQGDRCPT